MYQIAMVQNLLFARRIPLRVRARWVPPRFHLDASHRYRAARAAEVCMLTGVGAQLELRGQTREMVRAHVQGDQQFALAVGPAQHMKRCA